MVQTKARPADERGAEYLYRASVRALEAMARGKAAGLDVPETATAKMARLVTQIGSGWSRGGA